MRYADTLLAEGEVVILRTRQHWLSLFLEARWAVFLWVAAIVLLAAVGILDLTGDIGRIAGLAAVLFLIVGLIIFGYNYWQWWAQDYIVSNRRLIKVTGILNKRSADSSLEKINDAILEQNVLGRIMNYGDLDILTAADQAIDNYRMLKGPKEFKRVMLNAKHGLEMEMTGRPPSPPMRASAVDMNGEPTMQPTSPAPMVPPAAEPDESEEITQTLSRLADLRDKGAISQEEYAAKKDELLGRL